MRIGQTMPSLRFIQKLYAMKRHARQANLSDEQRGVLEHLTNTTIGQVLPQKLFEAARLPWSIEADNWVRDCTFREDRSSL